MLAYRLLSALAAAVGMHTPRPEFNPEDMFPKAPAPPRGRIYARGGPRNDRGLVPERFGQTLEQAQGHACAAEIKRQRKRYIRIRDHHLRIQGRAYAAYLAQERGAS